MKDNEALNISARIVTKNNVSRGEIVFKKGSRRKVIPALLFTPEKAKRILEIVDKVNSR